MKRFTKSWWVVLLVWVVLGGAAFWAWQVSHPSNVAANTLKFNGQRAYRDVEYQVSLGPRIPDSAAHNEVADWLVRELQTAGWETEIQEGDIMARPVRNVVACYGQGRPWIILGAHYDSRLVADRDPQAVNRNQPVPGANDGASGVAVLLELGRILPAYLEQTNSQPRQIWLVFFDAEDNGRLPGWDWILGSRMFVSQLGQHPDAAVVLDMIGDADLQIYMEKNSDVQLNQAIWDAAARAGYSDLFIPQYRYAILDDHLPFRDAGIPAVDLIDFDYPYYHTLDDTPDKVSWQSLQAVGDTMLSWLTER